MTQPALAVLGTGMMGPGMAVTFALADHPVALWGRTDASVQRGLAAVDAALALLAGAEVVARPAADAARARIHGETDLAAAVRDAAVVFESIAEDLEVKRALYARLETLVGADTILASNTSALRITEIAAGLQRPQRVVTAHFWNPPHLMPLVDVVRGERTSQATVDTVRALLLRARKKPVLVQKDVPGQLGNRLQHALNREAFYIVQQGIASAEDVDTAIKYGPGFRWPILGPNEAADVAGLDLVLAVQAYTVPALCSGEESVALLRGLVARGELGVKSGRGFYDWSRRDPAAVKAARDRFLVQRLKDLLAAESAATGEGEHP